MKTPRPAFLPSALRNKHAVTASPGVVSLLALILMATITATAVGASVLMLNELRQSESIDQSYAAIYASESGLEDALYVVSLGRAGSTLTDTKTALQRTGTLNSQSGWTWGRTVQDEQSLQVAQIRQDQTVALDYSNPDSATGASGIDYLSVNWGEDCDGHTQLETSLLKWQTNNDGTINFDPAQQQVYKRLDTCNTPSPDKCQELIIDSMISADQASFQLQKTEPYRFVFRPVGVPASTTYVDCSVKDLQVTGYERNLEGGSDLLVPIPSRLTIKSVGGYGRSLQALSASIAWKAPASALFNYVVFSELDVEK